MHFEVRGAAQVVGRELAVAHQYSAGLEATQQVTQGVQPVEGVCAAPLLTPAPGLGLDDVEPVLGQAGNVNLVGDRLAAATLADDVHRAGQVLDLRQLPAQVQQQVEAVLLQPAAFDVEAGVLVGKAQALAGRRQQALGGEAVVEAPALAPLAEGDLVSGPKDRDGNEDADHDPNGNEVGHDGIRDALPHEVGVR